MKRTILATAVAALLCANTAHAQLGVGKVADKILPKVSLGLKIGANMQKAEGSNIDASYKGGFVGGAFISVSKKKMGVRVEGLIKSAKIESSLATGPTIKTLMLDIPVLFEYAPIKRIKLHVGPQFTSLLSAKVKDVDVKDQFKSSDISVAAGLEVNLPIKLTVGARYIKGFVDMNNVPSASSIKNSSIQVSIGYRFLN